MPLSELLKNVADAPTDATVVVSESGKVVFANGHACHLLKYAPGELDGLNVEFLIPERFRLTHISHRLRFTDDRQSRPMGGGRDLFARCKDGSELPVKISLRPLYRGLETLMLVVMHDAGSVRSPAAS